MIRKVVIASGEVTTVAGSRMSGSADGIAHAASFNSPQRLVTDGTKLYVIDSGNNTIREVTLDSLKVTTFAGSAGQAGMVDGIGSAARFNSPKGITSDGFYLYVADSGNKKIRKIEIATKRVTEMKYGVNGRDESLKPFADPTGIVSDSRSLLISDTGDHFIWSLR
jgi:hypothetical protein